MVLIQFANVHTNRYKFKPSPILFYPEQLSAVVFGKQECRDITLHVHIFKTTGFLVKVSVCVFNFFPKTRGPMKPKFMWNHNRIGEEVNSNDSGHLLFFIIVSPR